MTSCIIVDDEKNAREFLEKRIKRNFSDRLVVLDSVSNIKDAVTSINKFRPELVFLDIEIPDEDGFELFKYFTNLYFDIIFTTAYQQYAIDAIRHSALDYLLKPISLNDLSDALKRLERKNISNINQQRVTALLENITNDNATFNKIAIPTSKGYELIKISNILYCEGMDNYNKIYTISNKEIVATKTLKEMEELLPFETFERIHKSYLVNLNFIEEYTRGDAYKVIIANGKELPVSFRKNEHLVKRLTRKV